MYTLISLASTARYGSFVIAFCLLMSGCNHNTDSLALGTLERDRITLSATANEIITAIHVKEGQWVSRGTPLLELDSSELASRKPHPLELSCQRQHNIKRYAP